MIYFLFTFMSFVIVCSVLIVGGCIYSIIREKKINARLNKAEQRILELLTKNEKL